MKKPLIIGVDASALTKPLTGIGQYTYHLLKTMINNTSYQWILFIDKALIFKDFNDLPNTQLVCYNKKSKLGSLLWKLFIMPKYLQRYRVDVFWSPCNILPLIKNKSTKYIITFHDMVHKKFPETMSRLGKYKAQFLHGYSLKQADIIITGTATIANEISQYYPTTTKKIKIIWHGTETQGSFNKKETSNKFSSLATKKLVHRRCSSSAIEDSTVQSVLTFHSNYILFVGTREPRKNLDRLIAAYALLPQHLQEQYPLILCGDVGWKTQLLQNKINTLNLQRKIIFTNYLPGTTLNNLLKNATLLVIPSLYEGFGLPVIEAMQYGLPLVLADIPVFHEVAGEAALFVNPYDIRSIAAGISSILLDTALKNKLKELSQQRGKYFQGWKLPAAKTLAAMRNLKYSARRKGASRRDAKAL